MENEHSFFFLSCSSEMIKLAFILRFSQGMLSESSISWSNYCNGKYQKNAVPQGICLFSVFLGENKNWNRICQQQLILVSSCAASCLSCYTKMSRKKPRLLSGRCWGQLHIVCCFPMGLLTPCVKMTAISSTAFMAQWLDWWCGQVVSFL